MTVPAHSDTDGRATAGSAAAPPARVRYGYFGPAGTFTEQALRTLPAAGEPTAELVPIDTVPLVFDAVRAGEVDFGLVPMENSVDGGVTVTVDELASGEPVTIVAELQIQVSFALLVRPGTRRADIGTVGSYGPAIAQTRHWLARNLPHAKVVPASSTAGAAAQVADGSIDAAVSAPVAARHYGLHVEAERIEDHAEAATRFVLITRPRRPPARTDADKTSVTAFIRDNHPGALLAILDEFAVRGIDLTRLESRPTGRGMGRYCFSIDLEGHVTQARVREALVGLRRICADVRFHGSYPRADGEPARLRYGTADADFSDAHAWLEAIIANGTAADRVP